MPLLNEKLKMISCSDFRLFLKIMINDKIEKEWTENFVENLNFIMVSRNTIKRRYEDKGPRIAEALEKSFARRDEARSQAGAAQRLAERVAFPSREALRDARDVRAGIVGVRVVGVPGPRTSTASSYSAFRSSAR